MPPRKKMRVIVEVQDGSEGNPTRYIIPVLPKNKIESLIQEVSQRHQISAEKSSQMRLTLAQGALLSRGDPIEDVVHPGEVVFAHFNGTQPKLSESTSSSDLPSGKLIETVQMDDDKGGKRVKIALITPELARNNGSSQPGKKLAFEGSSVSVGLTMAVVRREVARSLSWSDDEGMTSDRSEDVSTMPSGSCSCTVGNQMFSRGCFEQLHCPSEINGSRCADLTCKYSHVPIASGVLTSNPHDLDCKICTELFGFPCEKCLENLDDNSQFTNSIHCPLVQNAGCKHIFHAHCYFARTSRNQGCPAGCPVAAVSAEPVPFGKEEPHIIVVHSGCVVDNIAVPSQWLTQNDAPVVMSDLEVIDVLKKEYSHLGPGLTVRMFGRKNTGQISFRHSTIVSICCSTRHADFDGIVRLPLNESRPFLKDSRTMSFDLHTSAAPIFNDSLTATIEDLGLDEGVQDDREIVLYVVKRGSNGSINNEQTGSRGKRVGKAAVYTCNDDWYPLIGQTQRGMAAFLSSLLVFVNYISLSSDETDTHLTVHNRVLMHLLGLTHFPPAVRALYILSRNESITPEEARALSETMYHLCCDISLPFVAKGDKSRVFEGARLLFGTIIERSKGPFTLSRLDSSFSTQTLFRDISLTCELSGEPLQEPVQFNDTVIEHGMAILKSEGGQLYDPSQDIVTTPPPAWLPTLLRRTAGRTRRLVILDTTLDVPPVLIPKLTPNTLSTAIQHANVELPIHAPLSLKQQAITPALTLDETAFNAVYISRGGPCGPADEDVFLLRPCHGGEVGVDVNVVAMRLQPIIESKKAANDWDIDAFSGTQTDKVDTREPEEAIVVCLDLSGSMQKGFNANEESDDDEDEEDPDERAANCAKERFAARRASIENSLESAKRFINHLNCLPSIARFIYHEEDRFGTLRFRNLDLQLARRDKATSVLDELSLVYGRLHWQQIQHNHITPQLAMWEDFMALVVANPSRTALADHLLESCNQVRGDMRDVATNGVPQRLLDPLTAKIFVDPVKGEDGFTYERSSIINWLEVYDTWPMDPSVHINEETDLDSDVEMRTAVLGFLAGRPRANFAPARPSKMIKVSAPYEDEFVYISLPHTTNGLSILFDCWTFRDIEPSCSHLWHGLKNTGDGRLQGSIIGPTSQINSLSWENEHIGSLSLTSVAFNRRDWYHIAEGAERIRAESRTLSRLDVVKQAFEAFVNKSEAFDHPIAIGLITFGKEVKEVQPLTLLKERFRHSMRSVEAEGDTPLFDSLALAHSMLESFKEEHTGARRRIICLTDGHDIGSNVLPHSITAKLQRSKIIVDSITVQAAHNMLHPVSVATGGYSFEVETLETALNIVELETVLRSIDRIERSAMPIVRTAIQLSRYQNTALYPMDIVTAEECPGRKTHARLHERLAPAQQAAARSAPPSSTERQKRLMQEIRQVVNSPHPAIDVYAGDDLAFWKIVIEAPEGSPYAGGTFLAYADFGEGYPQAAPEIRFVTPILHPNINRHGKVCHAALDRSWLVDMTMTTVFQIIYGILLTPDTDNPLDLHATMEYNDDTGQHALKVHEMVQKFASKSRAVWREELEAL